MLICLTSTKDTRSLEKLCGYDEEDVICQVRQRMRNLLAEHDNGTWKHQVALIRCVIEQSCATKLFHHQLLDHTRTFEQNRQTYLSILGIESECVQLVSLASLKVKCKFFQMEPDVSNLGHLLRLNYLPIHARENLPWEIVHNVSYQEAQRFTAFISNVANEYSCNETDDHEPLFVIFRRLQATQPGPSGLGLPESYLDLTRNRLRDRMWALQAPNRLVLYVVAAFALSKDEHTGSSIHEFVNGETDDLSRATMRSLTRALYKAMRHWPVGSGQANKFMLALLGDTLEEKDEKTMCTNDPNTNRIIYWDDYWYERIDGPAQHNFAMAVESIKNGE